jgi:hypothetical protein
VPYLKVRSEGSDCAATLRRGSYRLG